MQMRNVARALVLILAVGVLAAARAETPSGGASDPKARGPMMGPGMMGHDMMGPGMMGPGMGRGMMGGMGMGMGGCPMLMPGIDVKVEKLKNGATLSMTSDDPKLAARIQKRAEIARLMHELAQEEETAP
jgi:hypothetical protein